MADLADLATLAVFLVGRWLWRPKRLLLLLLLVERILLLLLLLHPARALRLLLVVLVLLLWHRSRRLAPSLLCRRVHRLLVPSQPLLPVLRQVESHSRKL
jgi:hypothetical protein